MATQPLRYFLDLGSTRYECKTVTGHEGVSQTARFEVTFHLSDTDPLKPLDHVSGPATLVLMRKTSLREIQLHVTDIRRLATRKIRGRAGGGEMRIVLEPRLAMLRKRTDIRVFRNKTAPQIVTEVLEAMGVTVSNRCRDTYKSRPYCVQFRESDYDFAARLLEDDGIYYFVDDGGVAVIGDHPTGYDERVASLPFRSGSGLDQNEDSIHAIGQRGTMTAGKVSLRDFNHVHPSMNMDVAAEGPTENGAEWYDYPGEYEEPGEGQIKAKKRAEALACVHRRTVGKSFCGELRPGARFELVEAPMGVREGGYVITRVDHDWSRDKTGFLVSFESLMESTTYRPEVKTYVPTEPNPLTGFTTGPQGADIYPNEWGHVKVWFPWDRLQARKGDPDVSHWVPILQDNTGHSSAIMRTDWEVVCQFMEGDPDRPAIMGRVFNGYETQHTPLPDNKTRTTMRSLTSPRTIPGENSIQMEDKLGVQFMKFTACRDQRIEIANDKCEQTNEVEANTIHGNETIKVGNDHNLGVAKDLNPYVSGNQTVDISGNNDIEVGVTFEETVKGNNKLSIGGNHERTAALSEMMASRKKLTEDIQGNCTEQSKKSNQTNVGKESKIIITGSHTETVKKTKSETSGTEREEEIGGSLHETAGKEIAIRIEEQRTLEVGKDVKVDATKNLLLAGAKNLKTKTDITSLKGNTSVTIKVGTTQIKMEKEKIQLLADESIGVHMSSENAWKVATSIQDPPEQAPPGGAPPGGQPPPPAGGP